ncbi:MAG: helix-turn-helix transcriptional regulator [Gemmatimonadota bacterium]|nr:MAG: helix-turn-helix transcriptional regulator [Gemmatimonadota bacterium]
MPRKAPLGEFEQLVLLAILRRGKDAYSLGVRRELEEHAGRQVSRGAFYATLDRLESKGYVSWKTVPPAESRGGLPQRQFQVTTSGIRALRSSRNTLLSLWQGLETILEGPR